MVRLHYNLYQGDSDKASTNSRAYPHKQTQDICNNTLRQLSQELCLAWTALQNARTQFPSTEEYTDRSVKMCTAHQDRFSPGERTLPNSLDNENEVLSSKHRLAELRYLAMTSGYRISERTGELMNILKIAPPSPGQPVDLAEEDSLPEPHQQLLVPNKSLTCTLIINLLLFNHAQPE